MYIHSSHQVIPVIQTGTSTPQELLQGNSVSLEHGQCLRNAS